MYQKETTTIKAKKDLYNSGKCFTKGKTYTVNAAVRTPAGLMDRQITNDQGQPHYIGAWWRNFVIVD
jgi:hypothetical protein